MLENLKQTDRILQPLIMYRYSNPDSLFIQGNLINSGRPYYGELKIENKNRKDDR